MRRTRIITRSRARPAEPTLAQPLSLSSSGGADKGMTQNKLSSSMCLVHGSNGSTEAAHPSREKFGPKHSRSIRTSSKAVISPPPTVVPVDTCIRVTHHAVQPSNRSNRLCDSRLCSSNIEENSFLDRESSKPSGLSLAFQGGSQKGSGNHVSSFDIHRKDDSSKFVSNSRTRSSGESVGPHTSRKSKDFRREHSKTTVLSEKQTQTSPVSGSWVNAAFIDNSKCGCRSSSENERNSNKNLYRNQHPQHHKKQSRSSPMTRCHTTNGRGQVYCDTETCGKSSRGTVSEIKQVYEKSEILELLDSSCECPLFSHDSSDCSKKAQNTNASSKPQLDPSRTKDFGFGLYFARILRDTERSYVSLEKDINGADCVQCYETKENNNGDGHLPIDEQVEDCTVVDISDNTQHTDGSFEEFIKHNGTAQEKAPKPVDSQTKQSGLEKPIEINVDTGILSEDSEWSGSLESLEENESQLTDSGQVLNSENLEVNSMPQVDKTSRVAFAQCDASLKDAQEGISPPSPARRKTRRRVRRPRVRDPEECDGDKDKSKADIENRACLSCASLGLSSGSPSPESSVCCPACRETHTGTPTSAAAATLSSPRDYEYAPLPVSLTTQTSLIRFPSTSLNQTFPRETETVSRNLSPL